jgi:UDPglucose 6-dehydrogenase
VPFEILSNPEFLAEGTAIKDLLHPDRILIGSLATPSGRAAADTLKAVYAAWVDPAKIITTNLWSSELAKLVANAMLAQRISSINAISAICERTGADVDEVAHVIGQDQRLGSRFLKAGIGFGGSCFKKDILSLIYLSNCLELPEVGEYWMQVLNINDFQRVRFVRRIVHKLNGNLAGKKIAILGYAFKKDTNDTRESPAIDIIKQLLADAPLEIAIFDPQCSPIKVHDELSSFFGNNIIRSEGGSVAAYSDAYSACKEATAVVILTEWDQFRYPPLPVPKSAFHEGDQMLPTSPLNTQARPSEVKVLKMRESRRSIDLTRGKPTDYFDPLARFEEEPGCPGDCTDCLRAQDEGRTTYANVEWTQIASLMKLPRWIFDGRGIADVSGMENLGFRVESIGRTSSSSRLSSKSTAFCSHSWLITI